MLLDEDLIIYNSEPSKKKSVIDELDELDDMDRDIASAMAPSKFQVRQFSEEKGKKKKKTETVHIPDYEFPDDDDANSEWLDSVSSFKVPKKKKLKHAKGFSGFEIDENGDVIKGKKKKGKHKNKKGPTNYRKEFETEESMLRTLYTDQSKFTDNLQKKYDAMNSTKSSARGIGKFTTDLIEAISTARSTQLAIIKEKIALKGKIADLSMKERKEFGGGNDAVADTSMYASSFMNEILRTGRANVLDSVDTSAGYGIDDAPIDGDAIAQELIDGVDGESVSPFIEYEDQNVKVYVICHNDGEWEFEARTPDGTPVPEYPLPSRTKMSFNKSTMIATDAHGRRFPLDIADD